MKFSGFLRAVVLTTVAAGVFGGGAAKAESIYASDAIQKRFPGRATGFSEGPFDCWIPGRSIGNPGQREVFDDGMKNVVPHSPLAAVVLDHAKREDLIFCQKALDLEQAATGRGGGYNPVTGIVTIAEATQMPDWYVDLMRLHEAFHDMHVKNGFGFYSKAWTLEKNLKEEMYSEAAAQVAEIAIAFEMRQNGKGDYWQGLKDGGGGNDISLEGAMDAFEATYAAHGQAPHREKLERASSAAWKLIMQENEFQMTYAAPLAMRYLASMNNGELGGIAANDGENTAAVMGKIGDAYSLTRYAENTSLEDIFPDKQNFIQMVRGLDARRMKEVLGADDPQVKAVYAREEKNGNLWLTVDLKKFEAHLRKTPSAPRQKRMHGGAPSGGNPHGW